MGRLLSLFRLPARDRYFIIKVAGLVALIRIGLWVLPFKTLMNWIEKLRESITPAPTANAPLTVDRTVKAVQITSHYIPQATCLTQALSTQILLWRRSLDTTLRIGVAKNADGVFKAHAWVEYQEKIIIGGEDSSKHFISIASLEGSIE